MPNPHFSRALCRLLALCCALAAAVWSVPPARAGRVEDRPDGTTVIHVKVTPLALPDPANPSTYNRARVAAVAAFKARFPEIFAERIAPRAKAHPELYGRHNWDRVEIALEKSSGITVEGVEDDLLAIAGGMAADVLYINFRKSDNYIRNGFLYPLDGYLTALPQDEVNLRVHPKLWPVIRRRGPDGAAHVWAWPMGGALGKVLLYRKDLFDQHHLPYPDASFTWDRMLESAKTISDPERGVYGLLLGRGKHESYYWIDYLWSAGGEVMEYDEAADQWRCVFDSREAAVALDFYLRLSAEKWTDANGRIRRGYSSKDASGNRAQKWERGEIGMYMCEVDGNVFSSLNPDLVGMAPVPLGPDGRRAGELNSMMLGLFANIPDAAVRDAAWEFIRFYDGDEAMGVRTRVMVEGGLGQFITPAILRKYGYPEFERLAPRGWAETFDIAVATGRPEPYGRNSNIAYNLMTYPLQEAEQLAVSDQLPAGREERLAVLQGLLRKACARANEEMIGIIPPAERTWRRVAAALTLAAIAVTFAFVFRHISKAFAPPGAVDGQERPRRAAARFRRNLLAALLLAPAVLTILLWQYIPLLRGSYMAFFDYRLLGKSAFVGLDNFGDLLFDGYWWTTVWNAFRYSFLVIAMTFLPPVVLAVALQEVPHGKLVFRVLYYLPAVMTGLVTVVLFKQFYAPSEAGALNALVLHIPAAGFLAAGGALLAVCLLFARRLWVHDMRLAAWGAALAGGILFLTCAGMAAPILHTPLESWWESLVRLPARLFQTTPEPYRWLSDPDTAMLACVIPMVWAGVGPGCLIYLAALKGIPDEFYEAADIDGATFTDKVLFVVFPTLKTLLLINFVGAFIGAWYNAGGNILVMTGGGANTEVAGLHIWYKAFTHLKFGPASAMAWMLGFMLIGFTLHQLKILARVEFRAQTGMGGK